MNMKKKNCLGWKVACAAVALCVATAIVSPAQTFKTVLNFDGTNGSFPTAALIQGTNGNLYGVTSFGGTNNSGTIFEITTGGKLTTLYNFCSKTGCADGKYPEASLVLAANGNFYGTTKKGGVSCSVSGSDGCGTVFEFTPAGELYTLHTFCKTGGENCSDGANPQAPLIQAPNGDFYGTTLLGGNSYGAGTLFEITLEGHLTTLYKFCSEDGDYCHDGANPQGPMALAPVPAGSDGADSSNLQIQLYGTTNEGGAVHYEGSPCGDGLVWTKVTEDALEQDYFWCKGTDGKYGADPTGLFYLGNLLSLPGADSGTDAPSSSPSPTFAGTTSNGGANLYGVVYEVNSSGAFKLLHSFCAKPNCADGAYPDAPVVEGTDGNLYGTTEGGNGNTSCPAELNGCGTVFRITPESVLTTLHSFHKTDGADSVASLVQATNGMFYGTTSLGGPTGNGTIFSINVGLAPFVQPQPAIGMAGTAVRILGTDLTAASAVSFNGTAAAFKVVSATEITTTVPAGATTGPVEVTTPSGTLKSLPFQMP